MSPRVPIAALPDEFSARRFLTPGQHRFALIVPAVLAVTTTSWVLTGLGTSPTGIAVALVALVTTGYVLAVVFRAWVVVSADGADVLTTTAEELTATEHGELPTYTVLVPLYREGAVLPGLIDRLSALRYPLDKLQILLLLEADDDETAEALRRVTLTSAFEVVVVPPSQPRTKPKACNHGLAQARGEYCVIYDAEDRPDPDQLLAAVAGFARLPRSVVCIQAELQYWNPDTNWLTRCFAAEYAVNFSLWLRGLDRHRFPIPLGGTSNHFRLEALAELGAWDPYNVTEDADLGMRIARRGWGVRVMDSVTEEEANSRIRNWIRQRSRWIKGFYQTWLVHMRSPRALVRDLGWRDTLAFQFILGFPTLTALLNPIFWAMTAFYLVDGPDRITVLFPPLVLTLGLLVMVLGNLVMVVTFMVGCLHRGLDRGVRTMLGVPLYWALMSIAAYKAMIQLLRPSRRHFWELTDHGLVTEGTADSAAPSPPPGVRVGAAERAAA